MRSRILTVLLASLALCACATTPKDPNHYASLQAATADADAARHHELALATARAAAVEKCASSTNVEACMLGLTAMELAAGRGGGDTRLQMPAYQRPPTVIEQITGFTRAAAPLALGLGNAAVTWHQSDNSRDVELGRQSMISTIVQSATDAAVDVAQSGPRIDVAGDYTGGDRTTIGDDYTGGNRAGNDQIGRDRVDHSGDVGGDWRDGSPGPFSNDGDECTDSDCSSVPPEPEG
jgi:hypothetical protein